MLQFLQITNNTRPETLLAAGNCGIVV